MRQRQEEAARGEMRQLRRGGQCCSLRRVTYKQESGGCPARGKQTSPPLEYSPNGAHKLLKNKEKCQKRRPKRS